MQSSMRLAAIPLLAIISLIAIASITTTASAAPAATQSPTPSRLIAAPDGHPSQHYVEYRNAAWHFSVFVPDDWSANYDPHSSTVQFLDAAGNEQLQISAWPYKSLVVHADGINLQPPSSYNDQPDELGTVSVYKTDLFEITFAKNGMSYLVQSIPDNATSTLDILKSWEFI